MAPHQRIGVLMGGWGEERDVSIRTGLAVARSLEELGFPVHRLTVDANLDLDRAVRASGIEVAFLALHGRMGEDGRVQGLLDVLGIPYTGSGVLASALAMNKPFAKKIFRFHNLPTPAGYEAADADTVGALERHGDLGFPCVVKPSCGGSSVGLTVVRRAERLGAAIAEARRFGGAALVERWARGREVTVGILGEQVLGSCEVDHGQAALSHAKKYHGGARYHLPPRVPATRRRNVEALALAAYQALGCRGVGRVDLIVGDRDNDQVLEVNTLPGLTHQSLLPKIATMAGLSYAKLVEGILERAQCDRPAPSQSVDRLAS